MNVITMPISELKRPERNVRIHTDKQLKEFERSIRMFGQIRPLVVDETNTILAGVGCFETLCRMVPPRPPYIRSQISLRARKRS